MDKYWYEFWVVYYDDISKSDKADHGIIWSETMATVSEYLEDFYGKENVVEVQIKMLSTWENAPLLFDRGCEANCTRYWKKEEFEKNYD